MKTFQRTVLAIWMCTTKLSEQSIAGITYKDDFDFRSRYEDVHECDPRYWHPLHMPDHCLKMYEKVIRSKVSSSQPIRLVKDKPDSDILSNLMNADVERTQDPGLLYGRSFRHSGRRSRGRLRKRFNKRSQGSSNGPSETDSDENGRMELYSDGEVYKPVYIHTSSEENKKVNTLHGESHSDMSSDEANSDSDEVTQEDTLLQVSSNDNKQAKVIVYSDDDGGEVWKGPEYAQEYALANGYLHSNENTKTNVFTEPELPTHAVAIVRADESAQSYEWETEYESTQSDESEPEVLPQTGLLAQPDQYALSDGYLQPSGFVEEADRHTQKKYLRANSASDENESGELSELYYDEESSKPANKNAMSGVFRAVNMDYNRFPPVRSRRKNKKHKKYLTGYLSSVRSSDVYSLPHLRRPPLTPHERMLGMVSNDAKKSSIIPALGYLPQLGLSTLYRLPVSGKTVNMIEKVSRNYAKTIQDTYAQAGIFPVTETANITQTHVPDVNKAFINELKDKIHGIVARRKNDITKNSTRNVIGYNNKGENNTLDNNNAKKTHKLFIKTKHDNSTKPIKRRHKKRKHKRHKKKHKKRKKKSGKKKVTETPSTR